MTRRQAICDRPRYKLVANQSPPDLTLGFGVWQIGVGGRPPSWPTGQHRIAPDAGAAIERHLMAKKPQIIVAGILDTKGNEIRFLAERVRAAGGEPAIMELTVSGKSADFADIAVGKLAARVGRSSDELPALDRGQAADIVMAGGRLAGGRPARAGEARRHHRLRRLDGQQHRCAHHAGTSDRAPEGAALHDDLGRRAAIRRHEGHRDGLPDRRSRPQQSHPKGPQQCRGRGGRHGKRSVSRGDRREAAHRLHDVRGDDTHGPACRRNTSKTAATTS